ncbi:MAG: sulfatase-like hydrolase/transferase [Thermoanaerobaculia bacterium]
MPRRPAALTLLLAAALGGPAACRGTRRGADRPNVLLVTIDTTRADRLGCYGFTLARTPNLDRLAREGVRFTDAIAVAPITLPSHSSILTGLLPPAHGVRDNGSYALGAGAVTLAERLKAAGYATHALVSAIVLNRRYGLDQGFDSYDDDLWTEDAPKLFLIRDRPARKTADRLLEWLDGWKRGGREKPFFAWVHFFDPHQPYTPEAQDRPLAPTPYDAEIAGVDRALGRILERLRADGLLDDTVVVATADHGESLGEHGEKTHAVFVYDATVHVPLLVRYPRLVPQGKLYEGPASSVDIVPTLLALLGLPGGGETEGANLLPALRGEAPPPARPQYSESLLSEVGFGMAPLHAVRSGGFKYVRAPRPELYDLAADPKELANIFEKDRRRAALLDDLLQSTMDASARKAVAAEASPMSKETMEALRSLGYLAPAGAAQSLSGMDPKDGMPFYEKLEDARHAAQQKRWGDSERLLREILAVLPANVSARNVLALVLLRQERLEEAKDEYARSLAQDPKQARVLAMIGTIALLEGSLDEAEKAFHAALGVTPGFVEAMTNLGFVAQARGRWEDARSWYDRAAALDPGFPRGNKLSGDLWFEKGDYRRALVNYREVLHARPNDFAALIQAGTCQRRLGHAAGAERLFERARKARPDSWVPVYDLACLKAALGRPDEALELLVAELPGKDFDEPELLASDPDLAEVRRLPRFPELVRAAGRPQDRPAAVSPPAAAPR